MKCNFRLLLYSKILKCMILWFVIFEFGLRIRAHEFFSLASKLANSSQKLRHSARGQNMQIATVGVIRCVELSSHHGIWEEQAKEWEAFRYRWACFSELQTPLARKAPSCLYFRKTKLEDIVSEMICWDTPANCKATKASVLCSLHLEQSCRIDGFLTVEILCTGDAWVKI